MPLRAAHVSAYGLPRLRTLATPVYADFRLEATVSASAAILFGIQGNASLTAAAFSLRTFVATATAIKPVEDNVCTYTAATEIFR